MKKVFQKYGIFILALVVVVAGVLAVNRGSQGKRVVLIVTKDQSDTASLNPTRIQVAAQLALDDYYARNSKPANIKYHVITYSGSEQVGYDKAREYLNSDPAVVALVGDFNSAGTALLAQLAEEYSLPHLSFFATDENIFTRHDWSISYRNPIQHEIDSMLDLLTSIVPVQRVTVMYSTLSNLAQRWLDIQPVLSLNSIDVWSAEQFRATVLDFRPHIAWLKENSDQFDAILLYLGAGQIEHALQQLQIAGIEKTVFVTGVVIHPDSLEEFAAIDLPVYSFLPNIYRNLGAEPANSDFTYFADRYRLATGVHRLDTGGPWAYDGLSLLHDVLHETGEPQTVRSRLLAYQGERMVGAIAFSSEGMVSKSTFVPVVISGGYFIEVIRP